MASDNLGASFSIDVTNLKAGLAQANRLIRESESEFRAAAAGMDDWSGSQEGLEAKIKSLNTVTELQRAKVEALQSEYDRLIADGLDPSSAAAVELRTKINKETESLNKNESALDDTKQALEDMAGASDEAGDAADGAGKGLEGLKGAAGVAAGAVAAVGAACVAAIGAFFGLAESTRESRTAMGKLETAFATAGLSAQAAEDTFTALYGVLGDEGTATEAAQQLAQFADTEDELAEQTRILTGVFATYGDSIDSASLAEGIASTIAMSEVQGTLADALEWQGVNLDEFNASLAACTDEQEREALITQTLNGLYGEAADKYKEVNADVIAAQEAQAALNLAMNELGAIAEPVMTTLKTLATDLLTSITPFVSLIGEGLQGALNGSAGAVDLLSEGLTGILDFLLSAATSAIPTALSLLASLAPQLISTLAAQLPVILTTLISSISQALPMVITELLLILPSVITSITTALVSAAPLVLNGAISMLIAIAQAIPIVISELLLALPSVITTITTTLSESIPLLVDSGIQLLMAVVDAIPVITDALTVALPQIIDCIVLGLVTGLPQILQGGITLLMALIEAIPVIVNSLIVALPQIISAITSSLVSNAPLLLSTAVQLFMSIVSAIPQILGSLITGLGSIVSTIFTTLGTGLANIWEVGHNIVTGIWSGISGAATWLWDQITGWVSGIIGGIKGLLGINSPSRVMADLIGKNMALGIGEGFSDEFESVQGKITDSIGALTDGGISANINATGAAGAGKSVVVNQVNNYAQAHTRYELWQSRKDIAAAVRLANA